MQNVGTPTGDDPRNDIEVLKPRDFEYRHAARAASSRPGVSDERLELDSAEEHPAGVGLQADEPRRRVGLAASGIAVDEIRLLLAVQQHRETIVLDVNLIGVPLPGAVGGDALIQGLARVIVDRARGAEFLIDVLTRRGAAAPESVDLQLE